MRIAENLMTLEETKFNLPISVPALPDKTTNKTTMSKSWKLRSDFLKIPVIDEWYHLNPNTSEAGKQMAKLLIICNTLKITPDSLIEATDPVITLKKTLIEFKKICDAGNIQHTRDVKNVSQIPDSYREYEAGLKSFLSSKHYVPPQTKVFKNKKPPQYNVKLTDEELWGVGGVFKELKTLSDKRVIICAVLQHEIFARFESSFLIWNVDNIEVKTDTLDGIHYKYAELSNYYEPKQHEYYDKVILDPRVLNVLLGVKRGQPIIPSNERREFVKTYNKELRSCYIKLKKFDREVPPAKSTNEWYWANRPSHALRKSGSAQALRRCGFDYSNVSAMGWQDEKMLRMTYAQPKVLLEKSCEYCKPPERKQTDETFCSFAHYLAYQYGGKKHKVVSDDVAYLKARIKELESKQ